MKTLDVIEKTVYEFKASNKSRCEIKFNLKILWILLTNNWIKGFFEKYEDLLRSNNMQMAIVTYNSFIPKIILYKNEDD